jgi:dienelactone hydrolase
VSRAALPSSIASIRSALATPARMKVPARLGCGLVVAMCATSAAAHAEPRTTLADGVTGKVEFRTYTPASQRPFLTRSYLSEPSSVVSGTLSLPKTGPLERDGKSPAVILAHGSGGVSDEREFAWAKRFNSWGIAAFVVDSYTGRGIRPPVYADSAKYTHFVAHLLDAYLALQLLDTHPRIDGSRVAVMGFSRGGEVAVNAIFERFREAALGAAPNRFAAYIPLYPYCNFRHMGKGLATAPMLMLLGGADEMTEPAPCEHFAAELKERGVPVQVVVYANAFHGFDRLQAVVLDRHYVGIRQCEAVYDLDTRVIRRLDTGAPLATQGANDAWVRECRKKGARFGGDVKAREAAIVEVRTFLTDVFGR